AVFLSASEGFSKANVNATVAESVARAKPLVAAALAAGVRVRGYVSCITDCPYDGPTPPAAVAEVAGALRAMGCAEVSLGDTIGRAVPETLAPVLDAVLDRVPAAALAGHYHDTGGRALDNIRLSLDRGLRVFDASVGGLGGCPYAPGAAGNVDTVAVHGLVEGLGFETGVDGHGLRGAAAYARGLRAEGAA
ncbi:MAG: hydroxymethylglutaryl-CoA lyase, partial [Pseudomonadota bacterium]